MIDLLAIEALVVTQVETNKAGDTVVAITPPLMADYYRTTTGVNIWVMIDEASQKEEHSADYKADEYTTTVDLEVRSRDRQLAATAIQQATRAMNGFKMSGFSRFRFIGLKKLDAEDQMWAYNLRFTATTIIAQALPVISGDTFTTGTLEEI